MAIGRRGDRSRGRWHFDFREVDAGGAVSARLSRLAGREVRLSLVPDGPYLSERSSHAVFSQVKADAVSGVVVRSEEHTSELQSLMRISYAVFCLKTKKQ